MRVGFFFFLEKVLFFLSHPLSLSLVYSH